MEMIKSKIDDIDKKLDSVIINQLLSLNNEIRYQLVKKESEIRTMKEEIENLQNEINKLKKEREYTHNVFDNFCA